MKVDGKCMCGYLTYEADLDPDKVVICHCSDCQNGAGAYRKGSLVDVENFRLLTRDWLGGKVSHIIQGKPHEQHRTFFQHQ